MLGAQAVIATFVIDRREDLAWFYVASASGTIALVVSIIRGGRGIYEVISSAARGEWTTRTRDEASPTGRRCLPRVGGNPGRRAAFLGDPKETTQALVISPPFVA